jgi:formylglycine-generating enzyme required for sulfatase activity
MKRIFALVVVVVMLSACDDIDGNLVGVQGRDTFYPDILGPGKVPYGMIYVPSGAYSTGDDEEDIMGLHSSRKRTVSVQAFYMDASEISNNEYRQFVDWVRDSIAREKLYRRQSADDAEQWVNVPDDFFKEPYRTLMSQGSDVQGANTPFEPFRTGADAEELDKAYLYLTGYLSFKNAVVGKIPEITGQEDNESFKKAVGKIQGRKEIDLTLNSTEVSNIFYAYSNKNNTKTDIKEDAPKDFDNKLLALNGGRIENRKFFTLNWEVPIDYTDPETALLLSDMYLGEQEKFFNNKQIDTRLLFYDYFWIDFKEAAKRGKIQVADVDARNSYNYSDPDLDVNHRRDPLSKDYKKNGLHRSALNQPGNQVMFDQTVYRGEEYLDPENPLVPKDTTTGIVQVEGGVLINPGQDLDLGFTNTKGQHNAIRGHTDRSRFIIKERIHVYPDTMCWVRDFTYSFSDPMTQNYFWHTAYDNYPVVGVTWTQAKAFSVWRTQLYHSWLLSNGDLFVNDFRLPTETEWERGARGDLDQSPYPWGGPYIRNYNGCFLANFKPMRGRYFEDGGFHTVKVYSYNPNAFGLYCMAGNVSEWCSSAYEKAASEFTHDMNSENQYDAKDGDHFNRKRKVIRGGSWKDIGFYLMNSTRTYEYQDTAKCYIGFRNVMTHLGRGGKDLEAENGEEIQSDIQLK